MKHVSKTMTVASIILLVAFSACKKNNPEKDVGKSKFDINNPVGYFVYLKMANDDGTWIIPTIMEFMPGKTLKHYTAMASQTYSYEVIDGNVINLVGLNYRFVIEDGKITTEVARFKEVALLKAEETNQLAEKTFAGIYYKPDGSVLHPNFFYNFSGNENKVGAGLKTGTVIRTENYTSIGNIAAVAAIPGNEDKEFMVLVNGKLEVSYYQKNPYSEYYGSFSPQ